jgi:hypothetical protein
VTAEAKQTRIWVLKPRPIKRAIFAALSITLCAVHADVSDVAKVAVCAALLALAFAV